MNDDTTMPGESGPSTPDAPGASDRSKLRLQALSRWETEGGAVPTVGFSEEEALGAPALTNAEVVQLQVRVIALENLVIALLAESSDAERELAREMAAYISPRPGFTRHPLTIHAAAQMLHLVERAGFFAASPDRTGGSSAATPDCDVERPTRGGVDR
jgi:hypothetical protein